MFMPHRSGIWLSFGTCGKWDWGKRVSKNECLGKECKLTWLKKEVEDKYVPGWGSKQGKLLHKEKDVKVEREGRRCMWDWAETEVDMYDLTEPLFYSSLSCWLAERSASHSTSSSSLRGSDSREVEAGGRGSVLSSFLTEAQQTRLNTTRNWNTVLLAKQA